MKRNLVLSGGPGHDFAATTAALVALLDQVGFDSEVVTEPVDAFAALRAAQRGERPPYDLVTVDALRWAMEVERYAHLREDLGVVLDDAEAALLSDHVHAGGGLLALHTAVICFDAHPVWRALLGAAWDWTASSHGPEGPVAVTTTAAGRTHPITSGVTPFEVTDELYRGLDLVEGLVPLLTGNDRGVPTPVLWTREVGQGRVVTDLLGHGPASLEDPNHRAVIVRAATWAAGPARGVSTGRAVSTVGEGETA